MTFREWLRHTVGMTTGAFRETGPAIRVNRCVEWARAQTLVLEALGVKSRAIPVDVLAGNRLAERQLLYNIPFSPQDEAAGAWTVGVHHAQGGSGPGWDGHLVVAVVDPSGGRILVDGTADQFSRPARDLVVPPIVMVSLPPLWEAPVFTDPALHSGIVRYAPMPPNSAGARAWRGSDAWANPDIAEFARRVVEHLQPWEE